MKAGLRKMTELTGAAKFDIGMRNMLKTDTHCDVQERISRQQNLLINYVADNSLEGIIGEDGL